MEIIHVPFSLQMVLSDMSRFRSLFQATFFAMAVLFISGSLLVDAHASGCSQKAAQVAASSGGVVLSAVAQGNMCIVKILVKSKKGPPVRRTVRVRK